MSEDNTEAQTTEGGQEQAGESSGLDGRMIFGGEGSKNEGGFQIPDEYKDRGWAKGVDSLESLLKQHDNAQSLIGKKTIGVPTPESPAEEWEQFYNKMGRPEDPTAYEFEEPEIPEEIDLGENGLRSEEEAENLKKIFHQAGLTKEQAKKVLKMTDEAFLSKYKEHQAQTQAQIQEQNEAFKAEMEKYFGKEKDRAVAVTEALLSRFTPKGLEDHVKTLDDKTFLVLSSVLHNVQKNLKAEDTFEKRGDAPPQETRESLRARAIEIQKSHDYRNPLSPKQDDLVKEVSEIYKKLAQAR